MQVLIGLSFTAIYFVVFRALIVKFDIPTPGRGSAEAKLYTKADYKGAQQNDSSSGVIDGGQASAFIEGLGGKDNIALLTNCATRLRIKVHEPEKVAETQYFQEHGAVNMVRNGDSFQIIVGLTVPQVREEMTQLIRA